MTLSIQIRRGNSVRVEVTITARTPEDVDTLVDDFDQLADTHHDHDRHLSREYRDAADNLDQIKDTP